MISVILIPFFTFKLAFTFGNSVSSSITRQIKMLEFHYLRYYFIAVEYQNSNLSPWLYFIKFLINKILKVSIGTQIILLWNHAKLRRECVKYIPCRIKSQIKGYSNIFEQITQHVTLHIQQRLHDTVTRVTWIVPFRFTPFFRKNRKRKL